MTQVTPAAGAIVKGTRPRFRWRAPRGTVKTQIQICRDRACKVVEQTFETSGGEGIPPAVLGPDVHYWRVSAGSIASPHAWPFRVARRSSTASAAQLRWLDWNGDGVADLGVTGPDGIQLYLGSSAGPVASGERIPLSPEVGEVGTVVPVGDLDEDGRGDFVVGAPSATTLVEMGERFRGGLALVVYGGAPLPTTILEERGQAERFGIDVAIADVDADTHPDVIVASAGASRGLALYPAQVFVYRGHHAGFGVGTVAWTGNAGSNISLAAGGDVNGDGYLDMLLSTPDEVRLLMGGPDGISASSSRVLYSKRPGGTPTVTIVPDLDGDGYDDVIVTDPDHGPGGATVLLGSVNGTKPSATISAQGPSQSYFGRTVATGDLDADGSFDVAFGAPGDRRIDVYRSADLLAGRGPVITLRAPPGTDTFPEELHAGDFDGDGIDDLIAVARPRRSDDGRLAAPHLYFYPGGVRGLTPL